MTETRTPGRGQPVLDLVSIDRAHLRHLVDLARRAAQTEHDADLIDHARLITRTVAVGDRANQQSVVDA